MAMRTSRQSCPNRQTRCLVTSIARCTLLSLSILIAPGVASAAATAQENPATVPVPRSENWWKAAHERFVAEAGKGGVDVLFLGDSIIDNWRTVGKDVWQERFAPLHAANFGIAGDRTENVLWRLQNGELKGINPKVVVLLIGTNNWMPPEMAAEGIAAVVKYLRTALPKTKILLHGIFPRDRHSKELDKWIKEVNATLAKLHDGKQVHYLDIGGKFLQADGSFLPGLMSDGVHPSAKGYQVWADAIKELLAKLLEK